MVADPLALEYIYAKVSSVGHTAVIALNITPLDMQNEQKGGKAAILRPIVARIAGRSVVWAEGKEHTRQRQALLPFFTAEHVRSIEADIHMCS